MRQIKASGEVDEFAEHYAEVCEIKNKADIYAAKALQIASNKQQRREVQNRKWNMSGQKKGASSSGCHHKETGKKDQVGEGEETEMSDAEEQRTKIA